MRVSLAAVSLFILAASSFGEPHRPQIAVEVRFIEAPGSRSGSVSPDASVSLLSVTGLSRDAAVVAPVVMVRSGETGTVTCGTEYRYATAVDLRTVTTTNRGEIVQSTCIVPSDFRLRNVGTRLTVSPSFDPARCMIDIDLNAEVVSEPMWREYSATCQRSDGAAQSVSIPQPSFRVRQLVTRVSVPDGATIPAGGFVLDETRADEPPHFGWLGRIFSSNRRKDTGRAILITVRAQVVEAAVDRQTQGAKP